MTDRDWAGEVRQAMGEDVSPRIPRTAAPRAVSGTDAGAEDHAAHLAAVEARLTRIEALLAADLDKLGPAALDLAAGQLEARLSALADRIDALVAIDDTAGRGPLAPLHDDILLSFVTLGGQVEDLHRQVSRVLAQLETIEARLVPELARRPPASGQPMG